MLLLFDYGRYNKRTVPTVLFSALKEELRVITPPPPEKRGDSKIHSSWSKVITNKQLSCSPKLSVTPFLTYFPSGHPLSREYPLL